MASGRERRNFFEAPQRPLQKSHFGGSKCFFYCISIPKNVQIAIKHLQIMGDQLAISRALLQARLNPLKTDVLRGPPCLSGGPGPRGPRRNSTTASFTGYCPRDRTRHQRRKPWGTGGIRPPRIWSGGTPMYNAPPDFDILSVFFPYSERQPYLCSTCKTEIV